MVTKWDQIDRIVRVFCLSILLTTLFACNGGKMDGEKMSLHILKNVQPGAWEKLSQKTIFFGHQSVGNNIIEGIQELMKENHQIRLRIVKTRNPKDLERGVLAHTTIEKNTQPLSKIDAFVGIMNEGIGKNSDIAFMKFCYVDIISNTDVEKLFETYKNAMIMLKESYPEVIFVHFTAPLTSLQTRTKAFLKRVIGRPVRDYEDNIKRDTFNELLREEYANKAPIFDIALIESTFPDGRRATFAKDGKMHPYLVPEYTDDGGHLNSRGRRAVAEKLLIFLTKIK